MEPLLIVNLVSVDKKNTLYYDNIIVKLLKSFFFCSR